MNNDQKLKILKNWSKKFFSNEKDYENFDFDSEIDFSLTLIENKQILQEKISNFLDDKYVLKDSKTEDITIVEKTPHWKYMKYLSDPNLLDLIDREFDKKIFGEKEARKTIFMIANMRNVENLNKATDNLMVNAFSGTGKDHITEAIFELLPIDEKEELLRTTPKVLAYTRNKTLDPNSTWKKVALRLEDASNEVLNDDSFKVLSSSNTNKINKAKTVNKGKVIDIQIEGKPSIIMTVADPNPKEELLRRYPIMYLDEGVNQNLGVMKRSAEYARMGKTIDYDNNIKDSLKYLHRIKVKIPFADRLIQLFNPDNVIVKTHFNRFLDYIKSSCSLFQYQREKDEDGFFIPTSQDYEIARMMLMKTTSNILMIPLTKLRKDILFIFEKYNLENQSVDDLQNLKEFKDINITSEWLRKQLDWLTQKHFLLKATERRYDENGKAISKPVYVYTFNKLQSLEIPSWDKLTETSSITHNKNNSSITSNSSITNEKLGVNEVNELFEVKNHLLKNNSKWISFEDLGSKYGK